MRNGQHKNREHSTHPIVTMFLKEDFNKELYQRAHTCPTSANQTALDQAFKQFFTRIKTIHYISKLISGYSVDYDKRIRQHERPASLDSLFEEDGQGSLLDVLQSGDVFADLEQSLEENGQTDEIFENPTLSACFKQLKPEQQSVLIYSFFYGYKNKDIAKRLSVSEQRVSYYKKRALHVLKKQIVEETKGR